MKLWNEIPNSFFFNKLFPRPITIGETKVTSLEFEDEFNVIFISFDILVFPEVPPKKWRLYNRCEVGIYFHDVSNISVKNFSLSKFMHLKIQKNFDSYKIDLRNEISMMTFDTERLRMLGPSAYSDGLLATSTPQD